MRVIATFLCIIVLALSIVPCCAIDIFEKQLQKTELTSLHPSQKDKDDCCGNCSVFFPCNCCCGFILSKALIVPERKTFALLAMHSTFYIQPFIKEISLDIWQPPQLS